MRALADDIPYVCLPAPGVLLFGDVPQRRALLADAIVRVGGRVVASGPLSAALDRLDRRTASVVIDIGPDDGADDGTDGGADGGAALDQILDRLNGIGAASGRLSALVLAPIGLIDIVAARIDDPGVGILVDADAEERDAALSELVTVPAGRVGEDGEADRQRRLAQLSEEVGRIARALAALSVPPMQAGPVQTNPVQAGPGQAVQTRTVHAQGGIGQANPGQGAARPATEPAGSPPASVPSDAPLVRSILRLRRLRGLHFVPALFADPAWDILLDLAAARIDGRMVAVSSLCIAAAVPATTALRWITQMTEQGLLVRHPDLHDGRRVFIALADAAAAAMDAYLAAARRMVAPVA